MTAVLKGSKPANDVVTEAAFNYLDTLAVQTPAKGIATKIDAEIATIVGDAHTLLGKQTKPTNPKSRNANDVKYFTLQKALVSLFLHGLHERITTFYPRMRMIRV